MKRQAFAAALGVVTVATGFVLSPAPWLALIWLGLIVTAVALVWE